MSDRLINRGPDSGGSWFDHTAGIAFGHRRLAIVDTSDAGHQPMVSNSGRYVISLNGEIYNHAGLRELLAGTDESVLWRGHSDTETLLAAFDHWGIERTLEKCVGMFAFAVWDRKDRALTLARDRLGEKPLYYGWQNGVLIFGSELKVFNVFPGFSADVDRDVLAQYFRYSYISAPHTIYRGVKKLLPGTYLQFSARQSEGNIPAPHDYWSLRGVVESGLLNPFAGSDQDATDELESRLGQAVNLQRVADVPLGAFLSGGIDSSTIVALMQAQSQQPIKTFTIGFEENGFNEATYARKVAEHLETDHSELYVTSREAMDVIPNLPKFYDEPFGDSSAIPTFLVSQLARNSVTVSLSGDGGDELFGGYSRYQKTLDQWSRLNRFPIALRRPVSGVIQLLASTAGRSKMAPKARRLARYLASSSFLETYDVRITQCAYEDNWVIGSEQIAGRGEPIPHSLRCEDRELEALLFADASTYLPDDILTKVDRAAMAVSLESRVPMLSSEVVEFAWTLPRHMKVRDGKSKWLLRQVLGRHVPTSLTDRPKMGFGVPVEQWVTGPLREWAQSQLSVERLRKEGLLNVASVQDMWQQHLDGRAGSGASIWNILMFQSWLEAQETS